jgi:pimeloyl-ACP methyl ester carboxylesterase
MGKRRILTARGPSGELETSRIVLPREVRTRGHRLFYVEVGMGTPVILIHGLGGSSRWWFPILPSLSAAHFRLLAPDLPGFGRSPGSFLEVPRAARTLIELADRVGLGRFFVCGHSLGGAVAAQLAADYRDRIRALVLVNSAGIPGVGPARWLGRVMQPWSWCPLGFLGTMLGDMLRAGPGTMWAGARHLRRYDLRPVLERMSGMPTLVIWGQKDSLTPPRHAREIAAELDSSRLEWVPNAYHLPMVSHPEIVSRLIVGFFQEGSSSASRPRD